jgi:hypothetical protein
MKYFKQVILFCALFLGFFSLNASAKCCNSIRFYGKGDVAVWSFFGDSTGLSFESDPKLDLFVNHCNGKNKVYIYELASKGFLCQSKLVSQGDYSVDILGVPEEHRAFGAVTVSLHKIPQQKWSIDALNKDELKVTHKIAKKHLKIKPKASDCKDYWCDEIVSSAIGKFSKYEKKLKLTDLEIFIVPSERVEGGLGWELASVVIAKEAGLYRYIGKFDGCLINQPVDIDGDNIPEFITETCENSEGTIDEYYKIYPKVKLLVRYGG